MDLDPPAHTQQRQFITEKLLAARAQARRRHDPARADETVVALLERGEIDAVADLAHDLPVNIIMDLIGWPHDSATTSWRWRRRGSTMGPLNSGPSSRSPTCRR